MRILPASFRTWLATAAFAATAAAPSLAAAGVGRVVVMPFEGPDQLAGDSRAAVVTELAREHAIVPTNTWVKAHRASEAEELGDKAWGRAAKKAKVDAVVRGKIGGKGRRTTLSLTVIDAHDGNQIDRVEIAIGTDGLDKRELAQVRDELRELLGFIDGTAQAVSEPDVTDLDGLTDLDGDRDRDRDDDRSDRDDRDDDDDDDDRADRRRSRDDDDRDADRADREIRRSSRDRADRDDRPAAPRGADVMALFGDGAATPAEAARADQVAADRASGVRMFQANVGLAATSRSFAFQGGPDAPPDYPGGVTKALALSAAVYPMSSDAGGRLGGFGVSLDYARGFGSSAVVAVSADEDDEFAVIYQEWAAAAHYRHNLPQLSIDGSVGYRNVTHVLDVIDVDDGPYADDLDALDGEYGALTAGARIEFAASPKATLGVGADYLYLTSLGQISGSDMLGGGQAWGARIQGDLAYQVNGAMFIHAAATLEHMAVSFDGTGDMDATWEVDGVTDTFLGAQLGVGMKY